MKNFNIFMFIWFVQISLNAAMVENPRYLNGHGIGVSIGGPAIGGVTYRKFFENRLGFQTSFLVYPTSKKFDIITGAQLFFRINDYNNTTRFYGLLCATVIWESAKFATLLPGAGLGIEFLLNNNLAMALEFALMPIINLNHQRHYLGYIPLPIIGILFTYYI